MSPDLVVVGKLVDNVGRSLGFPIKDEVGPCAIDCYLGKFLDRFFPNHCPLGVNLRKIAAPGMVLSIDCEVLDKSKFIGQVERKALASLFGPWRPSCLDSCRLVDTCLRTTAMCQLVIGLCCVIIFEAAHSGRQRRIHILAVSELL